MGAMYREDDFISSQKMANERARQRELDQVQPGSFQWYENQRLIRGNCAGCGAPWVAHPAQNAAANRVCDYCKLPR